jgi:hypothetical protein
MEWEKAIYESLQGILVVFVMPKYQKKKRRMLDETNEKFIFFFCYNSLYKGYKLYNLKTNKVIVNRYVIFYENIIWNWEQCSVKKESALIVVSLE